MSNKIPGSKKLFRYSVDLETEGGEKKSFESVLLTEAEARAEMVRLLNEGHKATVILDKAAHEAYEQTKAKRTTGGKSKTWSHG